MRAERERAHLPQIALAGYTNAGKSTLLNALTGATVPVRDRLFHTLDPTTRVLRAGGRDYLLTDTVGFIRKLPHQLVDAFGATLEETVRADLVLHVVDASVDEEELDAMTRAVDDVLQEIAADEAPRLLVLAKADRIDEERRAELAHRHPGALLISAVTGEGIPALDRAHPGRVRATPVRRRAARPLRGGRAAGRAARAGRRPGARGHPRRGAGHRAAARQRRRPLRPLRAVAHRRPMNLRIARLDERARLPTRAHRRRRRPRPLRARGRVLAPGRARLGPHRHRGGDPGRPGGPGAAPVGARRAPRDLGGQRPGLIDSGYRGEVRVLLLNTDREQPFELAAGDRIAQLVLVPRRAADAGRGRRRSPTPSAARAGFGSSGS